MAPPVFPILYWRDVNSKVTDPGFGDIEELLASEPDQCLVFDNIAKQLEFIERGGDDPVTNEPGLNPTGQITVNKQHGRSSVPTLTLKGNCNNNEISWRSQADSFARKSQTEPQYHEYGIIGFYHPTLTDFNLEPTNVIGYTMGLPRFTNSSNAEITHFTINLSMGVQALT